MATEFMNKLYYGDNLTILQQMPLASVDLIYLDPPFNSSQNYNLIYRTMTGKPVPEQADAFCDTWELDAHKSELANKMPQMMRENGIADYYIRFWQLWVNALKDVQPHLLAYLIYMMQRLLQMRAVLRNTGSIYLHCDPTASHYIKVMMDGLFGHNNFRSEVIWKRTSSHNSAKRWGPVHDVILFYTKSDKYTWNKVYQPYDESYLETFYRNSDENGRYTMGDLTGAGTRNGESGQPWRGTNPTDSGRHWAVPSVPGMSPEQIRGMSVQDRLDALDELGLIYWPPKGGMPRFRRYLDVTRGVPAQDIISDIDPLAPHAKEKLGYPTQKPVALLERIIKASSNHSDVIFDPFCGCGTTVYAAEKTGRQWIGCDIAILAIKMIREVLTEKGRLTEGVHFEVDGIPVSVEQAQELFESDPYQFQHWAVERSGGFPTTRKSGDGGVDGRLYFETGEGLREMVISVKGGAIKPEHVRDLRGVLEREHNARLAGFISLREPTRAMREEAAQAGRFEYAGVAYDRLQLLTIKDLLEDKREFHTPTKLASKITTGQMGLRL